MKEEDVMYRFFLSAIPVIAILYVVMTKFELGPAWMQECQLHYWTGLYCPGCGATRAVTFLLHGNLKKSLFYYPAVAPTGIFIILYVINHTISNLTKGKIKAMPYKWWYVLVPAFLIIVNCIWKNYYYIVKGIALIP